MSRLVSKRLRALASAVLPAVTLLGSLAVCRDAQAIEPRTRDEIIAMSQDAMGFSYWWGHGRFSTSASAAKGSCSGNCGSCTHSGSYGGDCSGLAAKVWQIPGPTAFDDDEHPYGTVHFRNNTTHWKPIARADAKRGDAFTYNTNGAGHIFIYEGDDQAGKVVAYECIGCSYGCQHRSRSYSDKPYIVIRRDQITETTTTPPDPVTPPSTPTLAAKFVGQGSSLGDPIKGIYVFAACTNQSFSFWFDLRNTSDVAWTDADGSAWGSSIRLGATDDVAGPITPGVTRLSVNTTANPAASPTGGDCNDASGCQRVRFDIDGKAPATPGLYRSSWRLVDDGRGWFGPVMYLDFQVDACGGTDPDPPPAGGSGGSSGAAGSSSGTAGTGDAPPEDPGFEPVDPVEDGDSGETTPPTEDPPTDNPPTDNPPGTDTPAEPGEEVGTPDGASGSNGANRKLRFSDDSSSTEGACAVSDTGRKTKGSGDEAALVLALCGGALALRRKRLGSYPRTDRTTDAPGDHPARVGLVVRWAQRPRAHRPSGAVDGTSEPLRNSG
jgi:hypothetical protein